MCGAAQGEGQPQISHLFNIRPQLWPLSPTTSPTMLSCLQDALTFVFSLKCFPSHVEKIYLLAPAKRTALVSPAV